MKKIRSFAIFFNLLIATIIFFTLEVFTYRIYQNVFNASVTSFIHMLLLLLIVRTLDGEKILTYRVRDISYSYLLGIFITQILMFFFYISQMYESTAPILRAFKYSITELGILILVTIPSIYVLTKYFYSSKLIEKTILVIGENTDKKQVAEIMLKLKEYSQRYDIIKVIKETDALKIIEDKKENDKIQLMLIGVKDEEYKKIMRKAYEERVDIILVPQIENIIGKCNKEVFLIDVPFYEYNFQEDSKLQKVAKRIFELFISIPILILASPIMLITAIIIKMQDGGPVFYKQERLTLNGKKFEVMKFRSMIVNAEAVGGAQFSSKNDKRITPFGNFIRKTRIDELPQLLNIIKGDLAIVGPRPERQEIIDQKIKEVPDFNYRLKVKAGLTGLAQVEGKYNTNLSDKLKLDLIYIRERNFIMDLKIIIKTIKILFMKEATEGVGTEEEEQQKIQDIINSIDKSINENKDIK